MQTIISLILRVSIGLLVVTSIGSAAYKYLGIGDFAVSVDTTGAPVSYLEARVAIETDSLQCEWSENTYLFFSDNVFSQLIYYSHIIPILGIVLVTFFVIKSVGLTRESKPLLVLATAFTLWSLCDLFLWASNDPAYIMFIWSLQLPLEFILFYAGLSLVFTFIYKKTLPVWFNIVSALAFLPILLFLPTTVALESFNFTNCDREAIEGVLWKYLYIIQISTIIGIIGMSLNNSISKGNVVTQKRVGLLMSIGVAFFFFSFMLGNIIGTFSDDWSIAQYGLLGMPVFLACIGYLIVRYQIFSVNLVATEALVITLCFLVGSILFVAQTIQTKIVAGISLALVLVFGYILIRSVKNEIEQRKQITKLATELQTANFRLKDLDKMKTEFVSIASHQLRSPLTSIRGYTSMLQEGSYGKLPVKAQEVISKIADSSKYMALSIEDYLNVSRIEAGNMKYEMSDFNAKEMVEKIVDEMRSVAIKKGLVMVFRSDCNGSCMINADIGKTRQIVMNLLDNSMKYTLKGTITVVVHDDVKKKILSITVQDTGVGMSQETIESLFEKFVRAKNANCVNVTGTGLGLYVAKKMTTEMGAKIWTESEGEGKGSTFHVEFPLLPGKPKKVA